MRQLINCVIKIHFYEYQMATSVVIFDPFVYQKTSKNTTTIETYFWNNNFMYAILMFITISHDYGTVFNLVQIEK